MPPHHHDREALKKIAKSTLEAIERGEVFVRGTVHKLHTLPAVQGTQFFEQNRFNNWKSFSTMRVGHSSAYISILEISTLRCACLLSNIGNTQTDFGAIGILNFASAITPGGGFLNGAQAQEESIARSSTLYRTLTINAAQQFYRLHNDDPSNSFYTHSIIYSPKVEVFRDDDGEWIEPISVDVVTCAAVNAQEVFKSREGLQMGRAMESRVKSVMEDRMARILCLFEERGIRNIVLGSFGTGVFGNDVGVVAQIWANLLSAPDARFNKSFDRVMFAITGRRTFVEFEKSFNGANSTWLGKIFSPLG
jgi:uncharacterized protein (TIGR02452 family)